MLRRRAFRNYYNHTIAFCTTQHILSMKTDLVIISDFHMYLSTKMFTKRRNTEKCNQDIRSAQI